MNEFGANWGPLGRNSVRLSKLGPTCMHKIGFAMEKKQSEKFLIANIVIPKIAIINETVFKKFLKVKTKIYILF